MPERGRHRLEHRHQIAKHPVVGPDLVVVAPAVDQVRRLIERGIDEVGSALQLRSDAGTLRGIGQIGLNMTRAMEIARHPARQRDDFASGRAEVPQGGVSHQPRRARDDDFLVLHWLDSGCGSPRDTYQKAADRVSRSSRR
jgi:hypothetical protein